MYKKEKTQRGITLIALVITIIVMLILVGVTISMAVNGGLFDYAGRAKGETKNALNAEQELANGGIEVDGQWYNSIDEYLETKNGGEKVETISKEQSYVGYYADVDGDGTVDGVIYADLAVGNTGDGQWIDKYGDYTIPTETGLKDYYVSGTADGTFGNGVEVLTATGGGKDRFYVMALEDISTSTYTWYESKFEDGIEVQTSGDFGTGKANTATMIEIWNADPDEVKNNNDVWGQIQMQVNNGWFLPSKAEWSAFAEELGIIMDNYEEYGISGFYCSSSQNTSTMAWSPIFCSGFLLFDDICNGSYVRLSTTF